MFQNNVKIRTLKIVHLILPVKSSHVEGKFRQWVPTDSPIDFSTDDLYKSLFRDLRVAAESYELSSPVNGNPPNILRVGLSDMDSALMAAADPGFGH